MNCQGILEEKGKKKACWLPAEPSSPFALCRRCHFHRVTEIMDKITSDYKDPTADPPNISYLKQSFFIYELLHPAREQALLNLLHTLFQHDRDEFKRLVAQLKPFIYFSTIVTKRILQHEEGTRCQLYREFMKDNKIFRSPKLCWGCFSCVTWSLGQKNQALHQLYFEAIDKNMWRFLPVHYNQLGSKNLIDILVSLYLIGNDDQLRKHLDYLFLNFPLELFKDILVQFFQQPALYPIFFLNQQEKFLPIPLRDAIVVEQFRQQVKRGIKNRMHMLREDFAMKTWHPSRLFSWCLDIEDLSYLSNRPENLEEVRMEWTV